MGYQELIQLITDEQNLQELGDIILAQKTINRASIKGFIQKKIDAEKESGADITIMKSQMQEIEKDKKNFDEFWVELVDGIFEKIKSNGDYDISFSRDELIYLFSTRLWVTMVIAMKKCLGHSNHDSQISSKEEFIDSIKESMNKEQEQIHENCIDIFNMIDADSSVWSEGMRREIDLILHKRYHTKDKNIKKKNLSRVAKQCEKIMMTVGASDQVGCKQFSGGKNRVPRQFAKGLKRTFL